MGNGDLSRFAGVIYPDVLQVEDLVSPMLDVMGTGLKRVKQIHTSKNFQLGTIGSSLAISEKKECFAALDGFIENLPELKRALRSNGILTPPEEPSELLLAAYGLWGEKFIDKVDGTFSVAIFNSEKGELFIARDRIGKKPLYWYQGAHHFIFGSELKAIIATGVVPQTPAPDALAMYLYFGFIPQDLSPIKDVSKLLPGHYLYYSAKTGKVIRPYWSYSSYFKKESTEKPDQILLKLSDLLEKSTKSLIPLGNDTLGCFVTGGMGSAAVALELSRLTDPGREKGFSVCFKGENEQDVITAQEIAETIGITQKTTVIPSSALTDDLVSIIWNLDEPIADPTIVSTWKLCQTARSETNYIFTGTGSDEFLAGHNRYTQGEQDFSYMSRLNLIPTPIIKNVFIPFAKYCYPPAAFNILKIAKTNPWQFEFLRHNAIFDEARIIDAAPKLAPYFDPDVFLHKFHHLANIPTRISSLVYIDVKTRLPDHFMLQYERMTKAHGLSWRCPFLNRELIEYTAGIPELEKLSSDQSASYLQPLLDPVFSEELVNRPKSSRRLLLSSWAERPEIHSLFQFLEHGTLVETGIISEKWLKEQLAAHGKDRDNFRNLWTVLVLEVWFHLFINHPIRPRPSTTNLSELLSEP